MCTLRSRHLRCGSDCSTESRPATLDLAKYRAKNSRLRCASAASLSCLGTCRLCSNCQRLRAARVGWENLHKSVRSFRLSGPVAVVSNFQREVSLSVCFGSATLRCLSARFTRWFISVLCFSDKRDRTAVLCIGAITALACFGMSTLGGVRYTGHCPTLKFRVGKRFGANTEEIMKELLEKKILKTGPYRPNSGKEILLPIARDKEIRRDWKNEAHIYNAPPFILGYTGYIPGFSGKYGLSFMRAVEEGGRDWRETQSKLRLRRDAMRAHAERTNPRNLLSRARADNVDTEVDHGHDRERSFFENQVSPERPPIVGYTGHIPGAKGESALSRRYAQAAKKGLELLQKDREGRASRAQEARRIQRTLDANFLDETGYSRA